MCNCAIEPMRPSLSRGTNQLPNECLEFHAGRELRSVGRNFKGITAVIVVVIEIAEAKFGIDAASDVAAERSVGLHGNDGINVKTADIHFTGHVESLAQLILTADSDVGIGPIFGKTVTPIELCLQNRGNSLLRCHRVSAGVYDESEQS